MKTYGLKDLMQSEGYANFSELARDLMTASVHPAICTKCGYTTRMEPDQDRGWCEVCEHNTVKSAGILAGVI